MDIQVFTGFKTTVIEVALAFVPLLFCFVIFQCWTHNLSRTRFVNILKGMLLTFLGLTLFLQGVKVGFLPAGEVMGAALGKLTPLWIIIPIGFVIGLVTTLAEPSVYTLIYEVESSSGGYIPQKLMLYTLSLGAGISVAASMARIVFGIPLWYILLPGYALAFVLTRYCAKPFIPIAFDSASVTTGPMTVTFVLAITLGMTTAMPGRNPLLEGFGLIALVALSAILAVLVLGVLYARTEREVKRELE